MEHIEIVRMAEFEASPNPMVSQVYINEFSAREIGLRVAFDVESLVFIFD